MKPRRFGAFLLTLLLPAGAFADSAGVIVRVGSHDGYGRVTFALPPHTEYHVTQQDQRVVIQFSGDLKIGPANAIPHNLLGITGGAAQATLDVAPGTTLHDWRYGDLLVIDVRDPATQPTASPAQTTAAPKPDAAKPAPAKTESSKPVAAGPKPSPPDAPKPPPAKPDVASSEMAKPEPKPNAAEEKPASPTNAVLPDQGQRATAPGPGGANPPQATTIPSASQSAPSQSDTTPAAPPQALVPAEKPESAAASDSAPDGVLNIPADPQLGLAVLRLRNLALIVLDQPRNIDVASLRDDALFGSAVVQTLPTATVIRLPLDPGTALVPSRIEKAWRITAVSQEPPLRPMQAVVADDRLLLQAATPGTAVSVVDPDSGTILLVGTQRSSGQGVAVPRRTPQFNLLATWQGVAVEPNADTIVLRPAAQGFAIDGANALSPASEIGEQLTHSIGLTRVLDFPSQPNEALLDRLQGQMLAAADAPALARGPHRELVARTMMALGLGAEAGSVMRVAATDDPHVAAAPQTGALVSIAALLADRPNDTNGLINPALPTTDDIVFWRAVRLAELQPGSAEAAAMFSATAPLALSLPAAMRDRLLPLVAETLVAGGETAAAAALLAARPNDASLDFARAMLAEAKHDNAAALAGYAALAQSPDRSLHARASARAVELRLATGAINVRQAAEQLERLLYAWRGDQQERALRERLAELQARSGDWRAALGMLHETETLFPDDKPAIHDELTRMFVELLRSDAVGTLPPLDLVSLVEENTDLLPTGQDGEALQARLADRLLALDLPKRAGPVLEKLMGATSSPAARAGFGARLAAMRLRENDPAGALAALDDSNAPNLPDELTRHRILLGAEANARRGDTGRAIAALDGLDDAAADEARATILERANKWPEAEKALAAYVAKVVPASGKLDDAQRRALLRLATAAARAGDDAALAALREREMPRMPSGPLADMFRLLTADPVRSTADLKRSGQEATLAGGLPGQLKALQPTAP